MKSLIWNIILVCVGATSFILQVTQVLFNQKKGKWHHKVTSLGWWIFGCAFLIIVGGIGGAVSSYSEKIESEHADSIKSAKIEALNKELINAEKEINYNTNSCTKNTYEQIHETEVRITKIFAESRKKNDKNADDIKQTAKEYSQKIADSIKYYKEKQLPDINLADGEPLLECAQSNDTFFVMPAFKNYGGSSARNFNFDMFYMYSDGIKEYEYYKAIAHSDDLDIPKGDGRRLKKGTGGFMNNFKFDSTNNLQFFLILGSYTNDDNSVKKNVRICLKWNSQTKDWGVSGNCSLIELAHTNGKLLRFYHFP